MNQETEVKRKMEVLSNELLRYIDSLILIIYFHETGNNDIISSNPELRNYSKRIELFESLIKEKIILEPLEFDNVISKCIVNLITESSSSILLIMGIADSISCSYYSDPNIPIMKMYENCLYRLKAIRDN